MIPDPMRRLEVFGIVMNSAGRILLGRKRVSGWYGLPGGGIEPGETVIQALAREAREETGVKISRKSARLTGIYVRPDTGRVSLVYEVRQKGGKLKPRDREMDHLVWVLPRQLPWFSHCISHNHADRLRDWQAALPYVVLRQERKRLSSVINRRGYISDLWSAEANRAAA